MARFATYLLTVCGLLCVSPALSVSVASGLHEDKDALRHVLAATDLSNPVAHRDLEVDDDNDDGEDEIDNAELETQPDREASTCKYNLAKLARYRLDYRESYDKIRDRRNPQFEYGKGPNRFIVNSLPEEINNHSCGLPSQKKILTLLVNMPAGIVRNVNVCTVDWKTIKDWWPETSSIAAYDCNGELITCTTDKGIRLKVERRQNVLIVVSPKTNPDAFIFHFSRKKIHRYWCDAYPFT